MPTVTQRTTHQVDDEWSDLITSIPGAANATGFIKHLGGGLVEIIKGGAGAPTEAMRGIPLQGGGEEWCQADHIWVRCRFDEVRLAFDAVS